MSSGCPSGSSYHFDTVAVVAMTLRLDPDENENLRAQATAEGRSMQDVARAAVREYIENHRVNHEVRRSIDEVLPRYRELFDRLGRA